MTFIGNSLHLPKGSHGIYRQQSQSMLKSCSFYFQNEKGIVMNPIIAILKDNNINDEKISELFQTLTENPLAAMGIVGQLGIAPEKLQQLMALIMQNPALIKEAVLELGLDFAKVEAARAQLQQ